MRLKNYIFLVAIFCCSIISVAQSVPAGVGSNNIIWLEANDLSGPLADGFTWSDKSGNGFDAIDIADGSNVATISTIGGNQYLSFAGIVDEQLVIADDNGTTNLLDNSSEFSIIAVFSSNTQDPTAVISKRLSFGNASWSLFYNNSFLMYGYAGSTTVGGSGSVASGPHIASMTVDASLSGSSVKMFVNSDQEGTAGSNVSIPDRTDDVYIGLFNAGDSRYFDGDIAEIIVYRDALNGGERLVLENYLAEKYGITISADYFGNYANYDASYDDDLKGIGTEDGTELHSTSGFSSAFQIEATDQLNSSNEFVLFAHDNTVAHADNVTANTSDPDITDRWQKDYYIETSQNGVVDAATVATTFRFDFGDAGLTRTGSASDYVLLYRSTSSGEFSRVFANSYTFEGGDQIAVSVPSSRLRSGYYTIGRGNQITSRTWYVLQNGDWSDPNTWTLDAGTAPIPDNDLNETPGNEDVVVIKNGKTVTIQSTTNNLNAASITVDGTLDLTTSSGHDFVIINGQGTIRMSGNGGVSNFPDGNTSSSDGFGNPANGGLLIVEDALEFDQDEIFNDVRIQTDDPADIVAIGADLLINGDFNVRYGTLQFGDGTTTNRTLTVVGDFSVENNGGSQDGRVTTAVASNTRHEFDLYGDFLNEGTAQFSDRTTPTYGSESTNGVVDLNLISTTQNQRIDCNGLTYFYRIEIVKGSTDFVADIQADDPGNFVLTGYANQNTAGDIDDPADNQNAFGLITGTASVGTNVSVRLNTTGNYSVGTNAKLVVSGGEVTKTGGAAITPYGTIEVTAGTLEVPSGSGITTRDAGQIIISGGEIWTAQIRTSVQGAAAQGGFQQTGGTVNVWDYSAAESPILGIAAGSASATYARFCLTYEGNSFTMTGGTLNVKDPTTAGLLFINADPSNINVTGGQVNVYSTTAGSSLIASTAGFWNLSLIQESTGNISIESMTCGPGGADDRTITDPDLVVLSDLLIDTGAELVMNDNDLYIGEDLTIEENIAGVTYQPGTNTTYFNGDLSGLVTLKSTQADLATGRLEFNNVVLDKSSANRGIFCEYDILNFGGNVIRVEADMTVEQGFWNQGNENLDLQGGNITNKGILGVYEPGVTEGEIILRNDPIVLNTTDGAQFGYVRDNNRFGITLTSDVYIQRLRWRRGLWILGTNNLRIDRLDIRPNTNSNGSDYVDEDGTTVCENCLSANYMFSTEGNASDGGLSLMIPSDGINDAILRADNGDPTRDIFDYRGNVIANTTGGGANDNLFIFPVGIGNSGIDIEFGDPSATTTADTSKYTPLYLDIQDVTGVTEDSIYVTVRPVDGVLQTTDLSGGDVLSYYWSVDHAYTGITPSVTIQTDYYVDDLDGSANESLFVAGEVEDEGTYTRSYEDDNIPENEGVDDVNKRITFNGDSDTGLSLSNTNYTAGESNRFIGSPDIFYLNVGSGNNNWTNNNSWASDRDGTIPAGDYPQAGDIAIIQRQGTFYSGIVTVRSAEAAAKVVFDDRHGFSSGCPRIIFDTQSSYASYNSDFGVIEVADTHEGGSTPNVSHGAVIQYNLEETYSGSFPGGDFGDFNSYENALVIYAWDGAPASADVTFSSAATEYPIMWFAGGNNQRIFRFPDVDVTTNGRITVPGDAIVIAGEATLTVGENLQAGHPSCCGVEGQFLFPGGSASSSTVIVEGDLEVRGNDNGSQVGIDDPTSGAQTHTLVVKGDITIESTGGDINLGDGNPANTNVTLELQGEGDHSFNINDATGSTAAFSKIVMNKGSDTTNTFTFNDVFTLPTPTTLGEQSIEIRNGLLVLNDASIDVTLADGTQGDFYLPNTLSSEASSGSGGLEIAAGNANLTGDDTGIILDGLLRISGGTLDMSDDLGGTTNGNNFIQYGASDEAVIEVTAGSLLVGSQVRRALTSTTGLLNYTQTGGIARFGITAAPESTRGVFELLGSGSEFTHTGGEFTVVRENGSATVGSLIIKPNGGDIDATGSTITIGNADTPANQDDIGIDANVPLGNLLVTGNNNPTAKIYNVQLEIDDLTIQSGGSFDANGFDLTVNGDFDNDGTYLNGGTDINQQTTTFPTTTAQSITGSGTTDFFNLEKDGNDVLTVGKGVNVENDLSILDGTISTSSFAINLDGDMTLDATHQSDAAGPGVVFNGSELQNLTTTTNAGVFGAVTIDNANGVEIPGDGKIFEVDEKVILTSGVFNIGGNLLIMDEDAVFENGLGGQTRSDFSVNNMISVNASITDNGVRKVYNDSYTGTYLYPVGLNYYTPAEVNVTDLSGSSGNDNQITIKPIEDIAGGIPDDSDEVCGPFTQDYVDVDNILQFYWSIRSENVEDFDGSIFLYHVDELEAFDNTESLDLTNYAPARLLNASSSWDKGYGADQFDETNNVIEFRLIGGGDYTGFTSTDIAGTYTAGIYVESDSNTPLCGGAIPDVVPEYVTLSSATSGDVDQGGSFVGGVAPSLGESPDLRVAGDFTLNLTNAFWRFRKVTIETGATLTISGAGVNLGTVEGEGTLKLINTNALPAGDYASFEADAGCTTGGGFELEVTTGNSVDLTLPFSRLRRLVLSGDGEKVVTNGTTFNICENLEILDNGTLTMGDNTTFNIQGDIIKSATSTFDGDYSNARIVMEGSSIQQIDGDFTGLEQIKSLEVDNSSGLTVLNGSNDNVEIEDLIMTDGKIFTDDDNSLIIVSTGSVTGNFSSTTFVDGPLVRRLETSTDRQFFPVGDGTVYLPFEVSNTQGYVGTKDWTVKYHDADPGSNAIMTGENATYDFSTWGGESNSANSVLFREDLFEVEVSSPATADVRPYWDSDSNVGADANAWQYLRVMVWDAGDGTWESYGNGNANYSGMSAGSGSVVSDTELSFSTNFVTLGSNEPVALPVELLSFSGVIEDNKTKLTWRTATEVNNDYFEVLHSIDGEVFEIVGTVKGHGNSNEVLTYEFIHHSPAEGVNYYRLKQVDYDGSVEFHEIIQLENNSGRIANGMEVSTYPNPTDPDNLNLRILSGDNKSSISVRVMNLSGQLFIDEEFEGALMLDEKLVPSRRMIPGIYFMVVQQGKGVKKHKIVIK